MSKSQPRTIKRTTIKDVARTAGTSVTTVSNFLNGRTEAMAPKTLQRVEATIRALNYSPSSVARSLVTSSTTTIGVVIAEIETPLFLQALNYIEPTARTAGYNILLCTAHTLADEKQAVNLLLAKQVDGIIFLFTSVYMNQDYFARLPLSAPPMVLINRYIQSDHVDQINWDNVGGIIGAVEYLAGQGHRAIAHLSGPSNRRSSHERLLGYRQGLERAGLAYCPDYVQPGDFTAPPERWQHSVETLLALPNRPTAIIAANDTVAAIVLKTLQRKGLRVPADIAVIGVDDQPFSTYLHPALTTIQMPIIEAGQQAINLLLGRMSGQNTSREPLLLPCPLIIRESS